MYKRQVDNSPKGTIELFHGYTYSGIRIAVAAALAVQDIFEKDDIFYRRFLKQLTGYSHQYRVYAVVLL